jgi:hypothetical protein
VETHQRMAVMVWLSLGLVASGPSVAQSSPGSGEEISHDLLTILFKELVEATSRWRIQRAKPCHKWRRKVLRRRYLERETKPHTIQYDPRSHPPHVTGSRHCRPMVVKLGKPIG